MRKRGTYTLGIEVVGKLQELGKTFGQTQTDIVKYLVNKLYASEVRNVISWYQGITELPGKEPIEGNSLLVLPDVGIKYGMMLNITVTIPSIGMSSKEFAKLYDLNRTYIQSVLDTIREEVGG